MTTTAIWAQPIPVPEETIEYVDLAIIKRLPPGTTVLGIKQHGSSYWARTARIEATDANGQESDYFIKVLAQDRGRHSVTNEFLCNMQLYQAMPEFYARPIGYGCYEKLPYAHFVLYEFKSFLNSRPAAVTEKYNFGAMLAAAHRRNTWPGHKFGNPLKPTLGRIQLNMVSATDTWEECFSQTIQNSIRAEADSHRQKDDEWEFLLDQFVTKIIPRLIRPTETEGRQTPPTMLHGDMWEGNTAVDAKTGMPALFDGLCTWAPWEFEAGPWMVTRHCTWSKTWLDEYLKHTDYYEPKEEGPDRLLAYSVSFDLGASTMYPGNLDFRTLCKVNLWNLYNRYGEGYEPYAERIKMQKQLQGTGRTGRDAARQQEFVGEWMESIKLDQASTSTSATATTTATVTAGASAFAASVAAALTATIVPDLNLEEPENTPDVAVVGEVQTRPSAEAKTEKQEEKPEGGVDGEKSASEDGKTEFVLEAHRDESEQHEATSDDQVPRVAPAAPATIAVTLEA